MAQWNAVKRVFQAIDDYTVGKEDTKKETESILRKYKLIGDEGINANAYSKVTEHAKFRESSKLLVIIDGEYKVMEEEMWKSISKDSGSGTRGKGKGKEKMESEETENKGILEKMLVRKTGEFVKNKEDLEKFIRKEAISLDHTSIKKYLVEFLTTIGVEEESYNCGDLDIKYFKDITGSVSQLVAAGTKILDAIVFKSMEGVKGSEDLFNLEEIKDLRDVEAVRNLHAAKRAIQAGAILVYTQGTLPNKSDGEEKNVPRFIKEKIYSGDNVTMSEIGSDLSVASTKKFPQKYSCHWTLNSFQPAVASRCKLNIAGNRAIRYAVYCSGFQEKPETKLPENVPAETLKMFFDEGNKLTHAKKLVAVLRSLNGDYKAQLCMHPLSDTKPSVQKMTLKLTCAILYCMTSEGRLSMANKVMAEKNSSFLRDENLMGTLIDGERSWGIFKNNDADFMSISEEALKKAYGR
nr:TPA_asm: coat protein [Citrullus ophiovirus]